MTFVYLNVIMVQDERVVRAGGTRLASCSKMCRTKKTFLENVTIYISVVVGTDRKGGTRHGTRRVAGFAKICRTKKTIIEKS